MIRLSVRGFSSVYTTAALSLVAFLSGGAAVLAARTVPRPSVRETLHTTSAFGKVDSTEAQLRNWLLPSTVTDIARLISAAGDNTNAELTVTKRISAVNGNAIAINAHPVIHAGDSLTYTLTLINSGSTILTDVKLRDPLPEASPDPGDVSGTTLTTTFISASNGGGLGREPFTNNPTTTVEWNSLEDLPAHTSREVTLTVGVPASASNDSAIANLFYYLSADDSGSAVESPTPPVVVGIVGAATLSLTKRVLRINNMAVPAGQSPAVHPGDSITYFLQFRNNGDGSAYNLSLKDTLPLGTEFQGESFADADGNAVSPPANSGIVNSSPTVRIFSLARLKPNQSNQVLITVAVSNNVADGSTITNAPYDEQTHSGYELTALDGNDNEIAAPAGPTVRDSVTTGQSGVSLTLNKLTKTASATADTRAPSISSVQSGQNFVYRLEYDVSNNGNVGVDAVSLRDIVPVGAQYVSGGDSTSTDAHSGRLRVTFNLGRLAAHAHLSGTSFFVVKATAASGTTITNAKADYQLSASDTDFSGNNDVRTAVSGKTFAGFHLFVHKTDNKSRVAPGEIITYRMSYGNDGSVASTRAAYAVDSVPLGTSFVAAHYVTAGGGVISAYERNILILGPAYRRTVAWPIGVFAPGQTSQIFLQLVVRVNSDVTPSQLNQISNQAYISDPGRGGRFASERVSEVINYPAQLFINKSVDKSTAHPGDRLVYTMNYGNRGDGATSTLTRVADQVPEHTTFVAAHFVDQHGGVIGAYENNIDRPALGARDKVFYTLGALAAHQMSQLHLQLIVKVDDDVNSASSTDITNTALIDDLLSSVPPKYSAPTVTHIAIPTPSLYINKSADVSRISPGHTITYSMSYGNGQEGGTSSENTYATDNLPAFTSFVSAHFTDAHGGVISAYDGNILHPDIGDGGSVIYKLSELAPGQKSALRLQLEVKVDPSITNQQATRITNVANIGDGLTYPKLPDRHSQAVIIPIDFPVVQPAHLALSMTSGISTRNAITYEINYYNSGDEAADNVVVRTRINTQAVFVDQNGISNGGYLVDVSNSLKYVLWEIGHVPGHFSGSVTLRVRVKNGVRNVDADSFDIFVKKPHPPSPILDRAFPSRITISNRIQAERFRGAHVQPVSATYATPILIANFFDDIVNAFKNAVGVLFNLGSKQSTAISKVTHDLTPQSVLVSIGSLDHVDLRNGVSIFPLGGGQVQVIGPPSLIQCGPGVKVVASGAGNIVATGGGNIVATGGGNLITVKLIGQDGASIISAGGGNLTAIKAGDIPASVIAAGAGNVVASGGGNIVNTPANNLIGQDGAGVVSNDGGSLLGHVDARVIAAGAGNYVPLGFLALSGGGTTALVQDAGHVIASGGGNIISAGGGNVVAQGAGNVIAAGAGN